MPKIDNKKFYSCAIKKYGITARGLNWLSTNKQLIRFNVILNILPKSLSDFTVVDAGCGFGDFYNYLQDNNIIIKKYIGIDSIDEMCNIASKNTAQRIILADVCKDALPPAHYYICSGALNILTPFETYQFIQNCYNSSELGFIFNILNGTTKSDTYNYVTTAKIKEMAKELNVGKLILRDDYLQNDITVGFIK